ncbi:hypothetical protein Ddc_11083 [Ditylenchus destructor]|nr:hypothetical protein Ddc_11083 [Ditylenchus destructor]
MKTVYNAEGLFRCFCAGLVESLNQLTADCQPTTLSMRPAWEFTMEWDSGGTSAVNQKAVRRTNNRRLGWYSEATGVVRTKVLGLVLIFDQEWK